MRLAMPRVGDMQPDAVGIGLQQACCAIARGIDISQNFHIASPRGKRQQVLHLGLDDLLLVIGAKADGERLGLRLRRRAVSSPGAKQHQRQGICHEGVQKAEPQKNAEDQQRYRHQTLMASAAGDCPLMKWERMAERAMAG